LNSAMVTHIFILIFLLILSAIFSAAETAFSSANVLKIKSLAENNVKGSKMALKLLESPQKMISAILICNNVVNISASSFTSFVAVSHFGNAGVAIATIIITFLILIFSEITPKAIALIYWEKIVLSFALVIYIISKLLTPIIIFFDSIRNGIMYLLPLDPNEKVSSFTENELRTIVDFSHEEGIIESEERRMITNVVDFGDSLAKDVMVPRIDMSFANANSTYDELVEAFHEDKYTRMPVFSESRDNIIGVVNLKDLFFYQGEIDSFNLLDIVREPYYTYEYKKTSELLIEMRKASLSIAIVLDEYGATAGLITLEDLLEEIVGEIRDEYDEDEVDSIQVISELEFVVDGNTKIDDINERLKLNINTNDYDSIAGHLIYLLDHIPDLNESATDNIARYIVVAKDKNRIDKVRIIKNKDEKKDDE